MLRVVMRTAAEAILVLVLLALALLAASVALEAKDQASSASNSWRQRLAHFPLKNRPFFHIGISFVDGLIPQRRQLPPREELIESEKARRPSAGSAG